MIIGCTHPLVVDTREVIDLVDPRTDTLRTDVSIWVLRETTREEWANANADQERSTLTANMLDVLDDVHYYEVEEVAHGNRRAEPARR